MDVLLRSFVVVVFATTTEKNRKGGGRRRKERELKVASVVVIKFFGISRVEKCSPQKTTIITSATSSNNNKGRIIYWAMCYRTTTSNCLQHTAIVVNTGGDQGLLYHTIKI